MCMLNYLGEVIRIVRCVRLGEHLTYLLPQIVGAGNIHISIHFTTSPTLPVG